MITTLTLPFEIPTSPEPEHFTITLDNVVYTMTLKWNTASNCWVLDIGDINNVVILGGIPLVTGCDLLEQFKYMGFGGGLIAQSDEDVAMPPTFQNMGSNGHLYYITPTE